jgi:hypothetical protein
VGLGIVVGVGVRVGVGVEVGRVVAVGLVLSVDVGSGVEHPPTRNISITRNKNRDFISASFCNKVFTLPIKQLVTCQKKVLYCQKVPNCFRVCGISSKKKPRNY